MSVGAFSRVRTDTSSALRFGLTGLKPIRVSKIISRFGMKFVQKYTSFQPSDNITSFEDYSRLNYATIFESIKIPDHFESEKLAEFYANRSITNYKKDKELLEEVKKIKKSKGSIGPFIDFVVFVKERYQTEINDAYKINAQNFYLSDIRFSVYSDFTRTQHLFANFLNLLHHTLNYYNRRFMMRAKNDEKAYSNLFSKMKGELDVIIDYVDDMIFHEKSLQRLIVIWNAKTYENLKEIGTIKYENIPDDDFRLLHNLLRKDIRNTRNLILTNKYYRQDDSIDVNPPSLIYDTQDYMKPLFFESDLRLP